MDARDYIDIHYIVDENATVRQAAKQFGISKSTAHKDCVERVKANPK